jgi:hypothetical protein
MLTNFHHHKSKNLFGKLSIEEKNDCSGMQESFFVARKLARQDVSILAW